MTKAELVNLSLTKLGVSLITRLGDATIPASQYADQIYQPTLERILREYHWSFATEEVSLAMLPERKLQNWAYSYSLPNNFIRIISLVSNAIGITHNQFKRTGNTIHTNFDPVILHYIHSDIQPGDMDPDFREAFVVLLAAELAKPLIQSDQLAKSLMEEYITIHLHKAKTSDARETESNENHGIFNSIRTSPLNAVRYIRSSTNIGGGSSFTG